MGAGAATSKTDAPGDDVETLHSTQPAQKLTPISSAATQDYDDPYGDVDDELDEHDEQLLCEPDNGAPSRQISPPLTDRSQVERAGACWHAQVVSDDFSDPKHCTPEGKLKPHRPLPHIRISDLISGLEESNGSWYYRAALNEWEALTQLELRSLTVKVKSVVGPPTIKRLWNIGSSRNVLTVLHDLQAASSKFPKSLRATLQGAPWTALGWGSGAPGFVMWYALRSDYPPQVFCGEDILAGSSQSQDTRAATATYAHTIAHRYSVEKESIKDRLTWHVAVALEWNHGKSITIIEVAWRNGLGGYGGKSNWCHDKLENPPQIYKAMRPEMKAPWFADKGEIRMIDMPLRNKDDLNQYLEQYSGRSSLPVHEQRFHEPKFVSSECVRISHRSHSDIAKYLLNYIAARGHYDEQTCNCQTFAADLINLLSGKTDVKPFSEFLRLKYKPRQHLFLYDPA